MSIVRAFSVFMITLGLSFGLMTANVLAVKQAFAKPCPMEQMGKKHECPCCDDHCKSAMLSCAGKCAPQVGTAALDTKARNLSAPKTLPFAYDLAMHDQFSHGPAPPIPIA